MIGYQYSNPLLGDTPYYVSWLPTNICVIYRYVVMVPGHLQPLCYPSLDQRSQHSIQQNIRNKHYLFTCVWPYVFHCIHNKYYVCDNGDWTKWSKFCIRCFQMHFPEWKLLFWDWNFTGPKGPNENVNIDSGNGLVPNRQHVIIWNNVHQYLWCNIISIRHNVGKVAQKPQP